MLVVAAQGVRSEVAFSPEGETSQAVRPESRGPPTRTSERDAHAWLPRLEQGIRKAGRNGQRPGGYGEGLRGVAIGKREDSFEAIPEILASSDSGQAWDVEVPQIPQVICLVEVL